MELRADGIEFAYGKKRILKGVSFSAQGGQVLGIIGPNGSGKTTLLRCIRMAQTPQTGAVSLDGENISDWKRSSIAKYIGVVPQSAGISFPFTVLDVVLMGRIPHLGRFQKEGDEDFAIAREAMRMTSVDHLYARMISNLSGGEAQRVIIARALAQQPKILLLDEPTSSLDINHQFEIMKLIQALAKKSNMVVIIISHDLNLSLRYCDRLLLLDDGKVHASGRPEDVLTNENIKKVYGVEAEISFNPSISSHQVTLLDVVSSCLE